MIQTDPNAQAFAQRQATWGREARNRQLIAGQQILANLTTGLANSGLTPQQFFKTQGPTFTNALTMMGMAPDAASAFTQQVITTPLSAALTDLQSLNSLAQAEVDKIDGGQDAFTSGKGNILSMQTPDEVKQRSKMKSTIIDIARDPLAGSRGNILPQMTEAPVLEQPLQYQIDPGMAANRDQLGEYLDYLRSAQSQAPVSPAPLSSSPPILRASPEYGQVPEYPYNAEGTQSIQQYEQKTGDVHRPALIGDQEFVVNKEAVKAMGPEFWQKINEMYPNKDAEGLPDAVPGGDFMADGGMARLVGELGQEFAGNETIGYGKGMARAMLGLQNEAAIPASARRAADKMIEEAYTAGNRLRSVDVQEIARRTGLNPELVSKRAADTATTMSQGLFSRIKRATGLADDQIVKHLPDLIERVGGVTRRTLANPKVAKSLGAVAGLAIPAAKAMAMIPGGADDFLLGTPAGAPGGLSGSELPESMTRFDPNKSSFSEELVPRMQDGGFMPNDQAMAMAEGVIAGNFSIGQVPAHLQPDVAAIIAEKTKTQPQMPQVPGITQNMAHSPIATGYEGSTTPVQPSGGLPTAPVNIPQVPGITQNMAHNPIPVDPQIAQAEQAANVDHSVGPQVWQSVAQPGMVDGQRALDPNFKMGVSDRDQAPSGAAPTASLGMAPQGQTTSFPEDGTKEKTEDGGTTEESTEPGGGANPYSQSVFFDYEPLKATGLIPRLEAAYSDVAKVAPGMAQRMGLDNFVQIYNPSVAGLDPAAAKNQLDLMKFLYEQKKDAIDLAFDKEQETNLVRHRSALMQNAVAGILLKQGDLDVAQTAEKRRWLEDHLEPLFAMQEAANMQGEDINPYSVAQISEALGVDYDAQVIYVPNGKGIDFLGGKPVEVLDFAKYNALGPLERRKYNSIITVDGFPLPYGIPQGSSETADPNITPQDEANIWYENTIKQ